MRELVCPRHMCKVPLGKCMEWDIDEVTGERIQCNEKPVMSTTLYWCKQCNVPIYEESCPLCGEKGKYIATDIRPVFPEEKILLAILLEKDDPLCFEELSVWNNTNFYFIDGEKIQVSIKDFNGKTFKKLRKNMMNTQLKLTTQSLIKLLADLFKQMRTDIMKLQMRQLVLYRNIKKDIP